MAPDLPLICRVGLRPPPMSDLGSVLHFPRGEGSRMGVRSQLTSPGPTFMVLNAQTHDDARNSSRHLRKRSSNERIVDDNFRGSRASF
jgi:hypothetical protein